MLGSIVQSVAGHDKGDFFCVVEVDEPYLILRDGKRRKLYNPKRKKRKHTQPVEDFYHPALEQLSRREPVTDNEIRRVIAAFRSAKEV